MVEHPYILDRTIRKAEGLTQNSITSGKGVGKSEQQSGQRDMYLFFQKVKAGLAFSKCVCKLYPLICVYVSFNWQKIKGSNTQRRWVTYSRSQLIKSDEIKMLIPNVHSLLQLSMNAFSYTST